MNELGIESQALWSLAVTVDTANFTIPTFYILPPGYLYILHVPKKRVNFSLYNIQRMVFVNEMASIYFTVRPRSLDTRNNVSFLKGLIIRYVVGRVDQSV